MEHMTLQYRGNQRHPKPIAFGEVDARARGTEETF